MKTLKESILSRPKSGVDTMKSIIDSWLKENVEIRAEKYTINDDYTIDVFGSVTVTNKQIKEIPDYINFRNVRGYFSIEECKELTSLRGCPINVGLYFSCINCSSLTSLEGAPERVLGFFSCAACSSLTSLKGAPQEAKGDFYCVDNHSLTSLEGCTKEVGKDFNCSYCTSLTSLEGAPKKVGGDFICNQCGVRFNPKDVKRMCKVGSSIYT